MDIMYNTFYLKESPTTEGSVQWHYNEIEALKFEIELGESTNTYNSVEISALKEQIQKHIMKIGEIKGG